MVYNTLLEDDVRAFIQDRKAQRLAVKTIAFYTDTLRTFTRFCYQQNVGSVPDITPNLLRAFLLFLEEKGHKEGGIHGYYGAIKVFLRFWEAEFEPENYKNPILKVKPPRVPVEPIEGISKDNIQLLVCNCARGRFNGERDRSILLILVETGIRATELTSLSLEDLDLSQNSLLIRQGKGTKPRTVFFGKTCRKQLRVYLRYRDYQEGALFPTDEGTRLTYSGLRQIMKRLAEKAGIPEPGIHSFRRTFALECLRKGIDVYTISRLMGHTTIQMLSRYLRQTSDDLGHAYRSIVDN
jgi:site-specific recombinase XerD